jgi:hypothetical protein
MVNFFEESRRIMKKNFETEMYIDGNTLPLNNFVQETIGYIMMMGFSKPLRVLTFPVSELIKVRIKRLPAPV